MNYLFVAFLIAFLLPILIGSWRWSLIGLGSQAIFLALMTLHISDEPGIPLMLQMLDLIVIRGIVVPVILFSSVQKLKLSVEFEFIPTNFVYLILLFILVGAGLWFGYLVFPNDFEKTLHCGAAAAGMTTSFLVLSLQPPGIGQMIAILLLENSIILFELLSPHHADYGLQIALSLVFIFLIIVFKVFLRQLSTLTSSDLSYSEDKDLI